MPATLHPFLKRGLDHGDFHIEPDDAVDDAPSRDFTPQERAAKRRRVEAVATHYLRGKPPVILTAGLKGPFNNGWTNPWETTQLPRKTSDKGRHTVDGRSQVIDKAIPKGKGLARGRPGKRTNERGETQPKIISPEASRAVADGFEFRDQDDSLNDIEVPPPTAPLEEQGHASSATGFFSANTDKFVHKRASLTNPFWLRRPDSERRGGVRLSPSGSVDTSPTHSRLRKGYSHSKVRGNLQAAPPEAPLCAGSSPVRPDGPDFWRSSASASMIISSPAKYSVTNVRTTSRASIPSMIEDHKNNSPTTPSLDHASDNESGQHAQSSTHKVTSSKTRNTQHSSIADIQLSAERVTNSNPHSSASSQKSLYPSDETMTHLKPSKVFKHDLVASPVPASSTGFIYRRTTGSKSKSEIITKAKPRAIDFNSSSTSTSSRPAPKEQEQYAEAISEDTGDASCINIQLVQDAESNEDDTIRPMPEEQQVPDSGRSSKASAMSTQAAMLLAQLEFQESTYPITSSTTRQPWSQVSQDTPPRLWLPEHSPAIIPLSVFNNRLGHESVLRGAPISTQDLFGAASPFAFSTVKKQPEASRRGSLRFTLAARHDDETMANNAITKSPSPSAGRIPLKTKNTTSSFRSFVSEKSSQASQASMVDRSRRSINDVKLPQLDFHTSLDDFGVVGNLHFTDRFLRNLDNT